MNQGSYPPDMVRTTHAYDYCTPPVTATQSTAGWRVWRHRDRPIFATTGGNRRARLDQIKCYQPSTIKRRLAREVMGLAARLGIDGGLTSGAGELSGASPEVLAVWATRVRSQLAIPNGGLAFEWPFRIERGRMYAYFLDEQGHQRAFAKVGLAEGGRRLLEREVGAFRQLPKEFTHFRTPRLLADGAEQGLYYVLEEAIPASARHVRNSIRSYPHEAVREYAGKACRIGFDEVSGSSWWRHYVERTDADAGFADMVERVLRSRGMTAQRVHGNLTSMNVLRDKDGLWLIDWETYVAKGPVVVDPLSFYLFVHQRAVRRSPTIWLAKVFNSFAVDDRRAARIDVAAALLFMAAHDIPEAAALIQSWPRGGEAL
jgi:hypothetical protein